MNRLPTCFQQKIDIDRRIAAPVISITAIPGLLKELRARRSECRAMLKAPKGGTA